MTTPLEACRHCRTVLLAGHPLCLRCGRPGQGPYVEPRPCPICGLPATQDARFCAGCGQSVEQVGRVVTDALLHDPPRPPEPERVWADHRPSALALWPAVAALAVLAALLSGLALLERVLPGS